MMNKEEWKQEVDALKIMVEQLTKKVAKMEKKEKRERGKKGK